MAMAIGIVIGGTILVAAPFAAVAAVIAGGTDLNDDENATAVLLGASLLGEVFLLLAVALFTVAKYNLSWSTLGLRPPRRGGFWFPLPLSVAALIVFISYAAITSLMGVEAEEDILEGVRDSTVLIVLLGILSLALAPFMEELFFRGFLFGGLRGRWGLLGAALGSGLLFTVAHFSGISSLPALPLIGVLSLLLAWAYHYTGSLFAPMATHFLWNLGAFIFGVLEVGG